MTQQERSVFNCPAGATLSLVGRKYKLIILWHPIKKPFHYMELQQPIPGAIPKMLSQQLRGLETSGMISREVIPEKSPRTIYSLIEFGKSTVPVLDVMYIWGMDCLNGLSVKTPRQKQERG